MKKVLGAMSKFVAAGFSLAILGLLMSLTYGALQRIFPGDFLNTAWGLILFDIAAMAWALMFVFESKSVGQYAAAGIGFIVGFVGTLIMVAAEVILSGQNLAGIDTGEVGRWMVYTFIGATILHAALVYFHHAASPEISEQISIGIARGEVVSQAITDATKTIEAEKQELSRNIYNDLISQVKRDLGLHPVQGTPFEPRTYEQAIPYTVAKEPSDFSKWVRETFMYDPKKETPYREPLQTPEQAQRLTGQDETWTCVCGERNGIHTNRCVVCKTQRRYPAPTPKQQEDAPEPERPFRDEDRQD